MFYSILGVLVGYVAVVIVTMLTTVLLCKTFKLPVNPQGANFKPPMAYIFANLQCGLFAAGVGGYVAAWIAGVSGQTVVYVLGGLVLVFGILYAVRGQSGPSPGWYLKVLPVVGTVGVIIGGMVQIH